MGGANQKGKLDAEGKRRIILNFLAVHESRDKFIFFTMVASEYFQRENIPIDLVRPILEQINKILIAEEATKYKNRYLLSEDRRKVLSELWELDSNSKPKVFSYDELAKLRVIEDSEIPVSQRTKVIFEWKQIGFDEFSAKGKIKGIPAFQRNFSIFIGDLADTSDLYYDTDKGLELNKEKTIAFLYDNFYSNMKPKKNKK